MHNWRHLVQKPFLLKTENNFSRKSRFQTKHNEQEKWKDMKVEWFRLTMILEMQLYFNPIPVLIMKEIKKHVVYKECSIEQIIF